MSKCMNDLSDDDRFITFPIELENMNTNDENMTLKDLGFEENIFFLDNFTSNIPLKFSKLRKNELIALENILNENELLIFLKSNKYLHSFPTEIILNCIDTTYKENDIVILNFYELKNLILQIFREKEIFEIEKWKINTIMLADLDENSTLKLIELQHKERQFLKKIEFKNNLKEEKHKVIVSYYTKYLQYLISSSKSFEETFKSNTKDKTQLICYKHYKNFIAGALAGALSRTITAPLERLKILYQVNYIDSSSRAPKIIHGLKSIITKDGFKGLFRGNLVNLMKTTPDMAIKLYVFEKSKAYFLMKKEKLDSKRLFLCGALSGVCSNLIIFPLDVVKTRIAAAPNGTYNGILDTFKKIYIEGGMIKFYKGIEAALCSTIPNTGLNLTFYELLKRFFSGSSAHNNASHLSTYQLMAVGGMSAMISSSVLYPFQTIQSRMIMKGLVTAENKNLIIKSTMLDVFRTTYSVEGYKGFFRGYAPGITKIVIGNAIGFGLYENLKFLIH